MVPLAARPGLRRCAAPICLAVRYCGRECQALHWRGGHKRDCARLASIVEVVESFRFCPAPSLACDVALFSEHFLKPDMTGLRPIPLPFSLLDLPRVVDATCAIAARVPRAESSPAVLDTGVLELSLMGCRMAAETLQQHERSARNELVAAGVARALVGLLRAAASLFVCSSRNAIGAHVALCALTTINNLAVRGNRALVASGAAPLDVYADWRCNALLAAGCLGAMRGAVAVYPQLGAQCRVALRLIASQDTLDGVCELRAALVVGMLDRLTSSAPAGSREFKGDDDDDREVYDHDHDDAYHGREFHDGNWQ